MRSDVLGVAKGPVYVMSVSKSRYIQSFLAFECYGVLLDGLNSGIRDCSLSIDQNWSDIDLFPLNWDL